MHARTFAFETQVFTGGLMCWAPGAHHFKQAPVLVRLFSRVCLLFDMSVERSRTAHGCVIVFSYVHSGVEFRVGQENLLVPPSNHKELLSTHTHTHTFFK